MAAWLVNINLLRTTGLKVHTNCANISIISENDLRYDPSQVSQQLLPIILH